MTFLVKPTDDHGVADTLPAMLEYFHESQDRLVLIVKLGHRMVGKTQGTLKCRSDSKVVKTDVHYPTDLNLLWDSTRCLIRVCRLASTCECIPKGVSGVSASEERLEKVQEAASSPVSGSLREDP